jgi:chloramphenicol-sensitive protein RarD
VSATRRGYLFALAAYLSWGFFPLYFKALRPATAVEVLAHRIVWALLFIAVVLGVARRWRVVAGILRRPRTLAGVALAAALIAVNWLVYIYGVNSNQIVETSLGYFINPLVSVALGVLALRERMRAGQWAALGVGAAAVGVLTVDYGRLPWIALTLAVSFGSYGLVKKKLAIPAAEGLFVETAVLVGPALAYLVVGMAHGQAVFGRVSIGHSLLLVGAGVITSLPLMAFAGAANRIPLSALGMLQYLTPTIQLGIGVLVFDEPMPPARLAGFGLVWIALAIFTWDGIRTVRKTRAAAIAQADLGDEVLPEQHLATKI